MTRDARVTDLYSVEHVLGAIGRELRTHYDSQRESNCVSPQLAELMKRLRSAEESTGS
jgi:hypothetical protein